MSLIKEMSSKRGHTEKKNKSNLISASSLILEKNEETLCAKCIVKNDEESIYIQEKKEPDKPKKVRNSSTLLQCSYLILEKYLKRRRNS